MYLLRGTDDIGKASKTTEEEKKTEEEQNDSFNFCDNFGILEFSSMQFVWSNLTFRFKWVDVQNSL